MAEASDGGGEPGFRRKYYKARVLILLGVLLAMSLWWSSVTLEENRPVDWADPHRVQVCALVSPDADFAYVAQVEVKPGFTTVAGEEASVPGLKYWVDGWEHTSAGGEATLVLRASDAWALLERWRARLQHT